MTIHKNEWFCSHEVVFFGDKPCSENHFFNVPFEASLSIVVLTPEAGWSGSRDLLPRESASEV
jgi:hypothetical protein